MFLSLLCIFCLSVTSLSHHTLLALLSAQHLRLHVAISLGLLVLLVSYSPIFTCLGEELN
jgi:hypothetical protein